MKRHKLLLVDDEKDLRELVETALIANGFNNIVTAQNAKEALEILQNEKPDLILLDIMMPGMDGIELLTLIRESSSVPVILLTAKGESEDRILGLESGADDYIVKPFMMRELILRIEALLKRAYPGSFSDIKLNYAIVHPQQALVERQDGKVLGLTSKELAIFNKLYENAGNIVSINALCQCTIGEIYTGYENTLMSHIRHLREKIEKDPSHPVSLVTVRGLGYKLIVGENHGQ